MKQRECSTWAGRPCILSAARGGVSPLCRFYARCLYESERGDFTDQEWEVLEAWLQHRVCHVAFAPGSVYR